jgi:hypothetical protein
MSAYEYPQNHFSGFLSRALSLCAGHDYEAVLAGAYFVFFFLIHRRGLTLWLPVCHLCVFSHGVSPK